VHLFPLKGVASLTDNLSYDAFPDPFMLTAIRRVAFIAGLAATCGQAIGQGLKSPGGFTLTVMVLDQRETDGVPRLWLSIKNTNQSLTSFVDLRGATR
jgi:hypothetical protein